MERARIERRVELRLPREAAWKRVVHRFSDWFGPDATLDPRPGGRVVSGGRTGHVTGFEAGRRIGWEWSADGDPGWTSVDIELESTDAGTDVVVTEALHDWEHEGYDAIDAHGSGPRGVVGITV